MTLRSANEIEVQAVFRKLHALTVQRTPARILLELLLLTIITVVAIILISAPTIYFTHGREA